jgi:hypothetical protein
VESSSVDRQIERGAEYRRVDSERESRVSTGRDTDEIAEER